MKRFPHILAMMIFAATCLNASAFNSEDVTVLNTADSITLAGTVTAPEKTAPLAAIVMATGSGAQNRDEEIAGHRPFKVIAEHLSANGYAVLRMDDRGTAQSKGDMSNAVTDDFVTDIASGIDAMKKRYPNIPVGVIGHSEGGTIAVKAAAKSLCSFIVTLGAPAWKGDSIIMSQMRAVAQAVTGRWDMESSQRELLDIVNSSLPNYQARISLQLALSKALGEQASLPQVQKALQQQIEVLLSPWFRNFIKYDPSADISSVAVPWLAINGDKDCQVLPGNLVTIKALNAKAETLSIKNHNHLLQECITGLPNEYPTLLQSPSQQTLDAITNWLNSLYKQ